ncbi:carbon monoxide dehydrogenase subunit G [uncultured Roseibium sp.]|uniref:SRPBCC family protein n=1 Tax=uncultured Roseibium sp. TaxID=1936171 RepID=UPI00260BEEF7|nr:carbon monoxide dehydrogenase subunit G [uncultured Roseibium sp.]
MDMSGSQVIPAGREAVWRALNDPEVLKACIPGCESLEKTSDNEMNAQVTTKIGPVKAKFKGAVTLENINPPESYTITGEGKGGVAGFAKGGADIKLTEAEGGTLLEYEAKAQVGGKLAQLGSRLIDSTAKKMAEDFFTKFSETVADQSGSAASAEPAAPEVAPLETSATPEPVVAAAPEMPSATSTRPPDSENAGQQATRDEKVFGGPLVWGLVALGVVVIVFAVLF